jgi:hypothetical protein
MAVPIGKNTAAEPRKCADCGHLESEHGRTGTHPCLAVVGTLMERDFCPCNAFRAGMTRAA